jgi:excisionase family DNA binding protein
MFGMSTIANERVLLTTREAADRLGVSVATVRRAVADGGLVPIRVRRRGRFRFRAADVEALLLPAAERRLLAQLRDELGAVEVPS